MQEGALSLMQMVKISSALAVLDDAGVPYVSLLTHPTTGGVTASYAMLGDLNLAEPGALIGFAGPRVIRQTIRGELPPGFQRSEFLLDHGMLDRVVHRRELRGVLGGLLRFMHEPAGATGFSGGGHRRQGADRTGAGAGPRRPVERALHPALPEAGSVACSTRTRSRFLRAREQFHVKVGTRNIRLLAKALGHPERRFPSVVVAGTNGKGSTVAILDSILRAHGLRVGRFTSPHLVSINERILVNGRQLPNEEFADLVGAIASAARGLLPDQQPSFFETITGAAFLAFARHGLDAAVFEVGMGGRWDATTATDAPLGLVTRIALDHERYPGPDRRRDRRAKKGRWPVPGENC